MCAAVHVLSKLLLIVALLLAFSCAKVSPVDGQGSTRPVYPDAEAILRERDESVRSRVITVCPEK